MPGPVQLPSTPTSSHAFYIMWLVTVVLALIAGGAIVYVLISKPNTVNTIPSTTKQLTQTNTSTSLKSIQPKITQNVSGTVIKQANNSFILEGYYLTKKDQVSPQYEVKIDNNTICEKMIPLNDQGAIGHLSGSCTEIILGTYVTAIPTTEKIDTSFLAKHIYYSTQNLFGSRLPIE